MTYLIYKYRSINSKELIEKIDCCEQYLDIRIKELEKKYPECSILVDVL